MYLIYLFKKLFYYNENFMTGPNDKTINQRIELGQKILPKPFTLFIIIWEYFFDRIGSIHSLKHQLFWSIPIQFVDNLFCFQL